MANTIVIQTAVLSGPNIIVTGTVNGTSQQVFIPLSAITSLSSVALQQQYAAMKLLEAIPSPVGAAPAITGTVSL